jgi:3-oxoacyl-[acyl-carrier-protein] synthase II
MHHPAFVGVLIFWVQSLEFSFLRLYGEHVSMNNRVVVTGIGIISPLGLDRRTSWQELLAGKSGISQIESFDTEGFATTIAGEVRDFDPEAVVGKKQARRMDRFVQLAATATMEALEHSGVKIVPENCNRVSVMISSGIGGIITLSEQVGVLNEKGPSRISPFLVPMMLPDMASGQVSMLLGAKGPNYITVSACSSGADAVGQGYEAIVRGDADIVFAGGAEAAICPIGIAGFNSCMALSTRNDDPQGASRPFDAGRDGFVLGEGAGVLVLENMESAVKRDARILAEVIGYAATADAHHITQPAPEGEGAARAMRLALKKAQVQPDEVDYINAHGTSTPMNDKFETMAMKTVFGEYAYRVPISSTKSMTGHLLGAAGGLEAAISVMSIYKNAIPPTINLQNADPDCDLNYTPNQSIEKKVNIAMSNSFGFGGHNATLVFQAVE